MALAARVQAWAASVPPLYTVTAAIVAGDALGNIFVNFFGGAAYLIPFWIAVGLLVSAAIIFFNARPLTATLLALAAIVAGAAIAAGRPLTPARGPGSLYRFADGDLVTAEGWLIREPEHAPNQRTYLYLAAVRAGLAQPADKAAPGPALDAVEGTLRATIATGPHFLVGDKVRVTGSLRFPRNDGDPGEFDYRGWVLRQGIVADLYAEPRKHQSAPPVMIIGHRLAFPAALVQRIRDHIGSFIDANLDEPERSELRALIIGDRGGIDEALRQRFALTGMAHLLVISGLHLGIVAGAVFIAMRFLIWLIAPSLMVRGYASKLAAAAAALAAIGYSTIAGDHVSTVRALVMVLAYMGAIMLDRARELMASLVLAALVICFVMPGSTADIGFQLSFFAVGAILLGMRRFSAWWHWRYVPIADHEPGVRLRLSEWATSYGALSFWAMIGTAPLPPFISINAQLLASPPTLWWCRSWDSAALSAD